MNDATLTGTLGRAPSVPWGRALLLVGGLAAATAIRWAAQIGLPGQGLFVGVGFGVALIVVAIAAGPTLPDRPALRPMAIGLAAGLALVAVAALLRSEALPSLRPAAPFVPWVAVTVLVAGAEELLFRGVLFGTIERGAGAILALVVTTALFAFIHVPFYGVAALPLDLAVGLVFGGLRLATGSLAAPIAAHIAADLATWWM